MSELEIDDNFKISAGPGAGKTTFLISHIKKIVNKSSKLRKARKVACITYTNAAADSILERLDLNSDNVEVSTIHSFLYSNILKPYWDLIPHELDINIKKVDGHDEIPITGGLIYKWKEKTEQLYIDNDKKVAKALKSLAWQISNIGELELSPIKIHLGNLGNYWIKKDSYIEYKKLYWRRGQLAHEDVLYLSYQLIKENPGILRFLKARFPFIFVDEFQDTSPLQYEIFKKISSSDITAGVIGDWGQSIYQFQGASPEYFQSIALQDMKEITIEKNYRSSSAIVELLNKLRTDIEQTCDSSIEPRHLKLIVGDSDKVIRKVESIIGCTPNILTRKNEEANLINNEYERTNVSYSLAENLSADSNSHRRLSIFRSIKSIIYCKNGQFKDSIKEIEKVIGSSIDHDLKKKKTALKILKQVLSTYDEIAELSLTNFLKKIQELYTTVNITGLRTGSAKSFYDQHTVKDVIISIDRSESNDIAQTIHRAKGLEFNSVLLMLGGDNSDIEELSFMLTPDLENNEEHRIRYVGISRAIQDLFIGIPTLSEDLFERIEGLGFELIVI